jgi:hypothetical protein
VTAAASISKPLHPAMKLLRACLRWIILVPLWIGIQGFYVIMDFVGRVRTRWAEPGDPSVDR